MEDRYGALTKRKETFTRVVDTAVKVGTTAGGELRDEAQMLVEYIKEYYMNYPLRAQPNSVTGCLFDELEFYSLPEDSIKAFHRSFRPETAKSRSDIKLLDKASSPAADAPAKEPATETASSPVAESLTPEHKKESGSAELYEMLKVGSPMVLSSLAGAEDLSASVGRGAEDRARTNRVLAQGLSQSTAALMETEYHNVWKAKTVHLGFGNEAIVSIVRAPYAESRIIVRDLTGKHAWIVTEHRAVDFGCLDTIDYNDKAAVYKNVLNLKGDKKLIKDIITSGKSEPASEEKAKPEYTPQSKETIEEELKRIEGTDTFTRVVSLLTKHCADTKLVYLSLGHHPLIVQGRARELGEAADRAQRKGHRRLRGAVRQAGTVGGNPAQPGGTGIADAKGGGVQVGRAVGEQAVLRRTRTIRLRPSAALPVGRP